jgi:hypothetical protein
LSNTRLGTAKSPEKQRAPVRGPLLRTLARTPEVSQGATKSTIVHWHHLLVYRMANPESVDGRNSTSGPHCQCVQCHHWPAHHTRALNPIIPQYRPVVKLASNPARDRRPQWRHARRDPASRLAPSESLAHRPPSKVSKHWQPAPDRLPSSPWVAGTFHRAPAHGLDSSARFSYNEL